MDSAAAVQAILENKLIVVLRHIATANLDEVAGALWEGGVRVVEVALNTPGAFEQLGILRRHRFCLGAGTALEEAVATAALNAGAQFLFSPIRSDFFLPLCRRRGVLGIPGGLTPTEIYRLWGEGAELIKVFPTSVAGPDYLQEILAPCEGLRLVPTGGITLESLERYLQVGAVAVGVGREIVDPCLVAERNFAEVTRRAAEFTERIQSLSRLPAQQTAGETR